MQFFLDKYLHTVTKPIFLSKKISIFIKDNIWIFAPKFLFCENKIPKNMNFNYVTFLIKNVNIANVDFWRENSNFQMRLFHSEIQTPSWKNFQDTFSW